MGIHDDDVQRVKEETDITGVISQYVALRKVGRRFVGLCPFHNEKTPSFSVSPDDGFYYCFGCQENGDAISFVRAMEQLDFVGAVERLADKAGIPLRYTNEGDGRRRRERTELSDLVERAAVFYHQRLLESPDAGKARAYLRGRGYDRETVERFRLGYAPAGWDELSRYLKAPMAQLAAAGLAFENSRGRPTDFFRDRLMFPIHDPNGSAIAFGGRMLPDGQQPKYKNSAANGIYDKSKVLYALNWAKKSIVDAGRVVVCEGYTDVIGCHRAGVTQAVATCGTALTDDHVKLMTRFANKLVLAFDADGAGRAAADRFYSWERSHDIEVFVADMPDGADPGELAERDPEALRAALDGARPFLDYRIRRVLDGAQLDRPEGRARAAESAASVIAEHPNELVRDQYLVEVAGTCRVDVSQMRALVANPPRRAATPRDEPPPPDPDDPFYRDLQEPIDDEGYPARPRSIAPPVAEVNVLRALVQHPQDVAPLMVSVMFTHPTTIAAFDVVSGGDAAVDPAADWRSGLDGLDPGVASLLRMLTVEELDADPVELVSRALDRVVARWRTEMLHDAAGDLERLRQWGPLDQWLALRQEEMHVEVTRPAAVVALVEWLRTHPFPGEDAA